MIPVVVDVALIFLASICLLVSSLRFVGLYRGRMVDMRLRSPGVLTYLALGPVCAAPGIIGAVNLIQLHHVNFWLVIAPAIVVSGYCNGLPIGFHNHALRRAAARTVARFNTGGPVLPSSSP